MLTMTEDVMCDRHGAGEAVRNAIFVSLQNIDWSDPITWHHVGAGFVIFALFVTCMVIGLLYYNLRRKLRNSSNLNQAINNLESIRYQCHQVYEEIKRLQSQLDATVNGDKVKKVKDEKICCCQCAAALYQYAFDKMSETYKEAMKALTCHRCAVFETAVEAEPVVDSGPKHE